MNKEIKGVAAKAVLSFLLVFSIIGGMLIYGIQGAYSEYYEYKIDGEFIGYYESEQEYLDVLNNCLAEDYEDEIKVTKFSPIHEPSYSKAYVKPSYARKFDNYDLVNKRLTKEYTIYKIVENGVVKTHAVTLAQAELAVVELRHNANKSTAINIIPFQVTDLSLIIDENAIGGGNLEIYTECNLNYEVDRATIDKALKNDEYIWPTDSTRITSTYGYRTLYGQTALHKGLDIGCDSNSPVYAMGDGVVIAATNGGGYGNYVKIKHNDGTITLYGHNNKLLVSEGQTVKQGDKIALSGSTGNSTGPHLHVEFIVNGSYINPQKYI